MTYTLAERYELARSTPSDIFLHLPRFVGMVEALNAQHVIELGSRSGVSTVAWLYALERTGGRLTSIDLDVAPEIGTWSHWRHIQGNDQDPAIVSALDPAEIVFLDTSHLLHETRAELNLYKWLVQPGGILVCHDYELAWPEGADRRDGPYPVKRAVNEFVKENQFELAVFSDCWGLAIVKGF